LIKTALGFEIFSRERCENGIIKFENWHFGRVAKKRGKVFVGILCVREAGMEMWRSLNCMEDTRRLELLDELEVDETLKFQLQLARN
jgi:hypothetical protein